MATVARQKQKTEPAKPAKAVNRVFKGKQFAKEASKRGITDKELCEAMTEVMAGQCDDLGGGVFKKRLNDNMDRSIVLAKGRKFWIFAHLFLKSAQANIASDELEHFKSLAKVFAGLQDDKLNELLKKKELLEICHDC